eukprot:SAG11_NODE_5243_length_1618_cov_4.670836_1_plen_30_part_10
MAKTVVVNGVTYTLPSTITIDFDRDTQKFN